MSLAFYAYGESKFTAMLILSILMNWGFGLWVDRRRAEGKRAVSILALAIVGNLGILAYFKYWMFLLENVNYFTGSVLPIPRIMLPIGISFFTFQAITYVLDVYRGKGVVQKNPLNVGLYIAFFPQLVAGTIVRYETIAAQIRDRRETFDDFSEGVYRFVVGLGKKLLIANNLSYAADAAFSASGDELSTGLAWLGAIAYTSKSTSISPATPTWRSVWDECSAFASSKISTIRTSPPRSVNSGAGGTFRSARFFAITSTFLSAGTASPDHV